MKKKSRISKLPEIEKEIEQLNVKMKPLREIPEVQEFERLYQKYLPLYARKELLLSLEGES